MKANKFLTLLAALVLGATTTPLMAGNPPIFGDLFKDTPKRHLEMNWFWGFNNWGDNIFSGFGGTTGDAEVSYYFMDYGFTLDYPLVNASHFGLYAGLGMEGDLYHFTSPLVSSTATGFQASTPMATTTTGTLDPDNWDSYFSNFAIVLPITISVEPWKYDKFCIRLSAIPGINIFSYLHQNYESKALNLQVTDKDCGKKASSFMLDTRLTLMYKNIGLYAQVSTMPLFKDGFQDLYPVKFGFIWSISGR